MNVVALFALVAFTSIPFIVDPIAVISTGLVVTHRETPAPRAATARSACLTAITLPAFRIAGG